MPMLCQMSPRTLYGCGHRRTNGDEAHSQICSNALRAYAGILNPNPPAVLPAPDVFASAGISGCLGIRWIVGWGHGRIYLRASGTRCAIAICVMRADVSTADDLPYMEGCQGT
jgi:hypothetical protein